MNTKQRLIKERWMREFETEVLRLRPGLAGRIDWDTANYLFNNCPALLPVQVALKYVAAQMDGN